MGKGKQISLPELIKNHSRECIFESFFSVSMGLGVGVVKGRCDISFVTLFKTVLANSVLLRMLH